MSLIFKKIAKVLFILMSFYLRGGDWQPAIKHLTCTPIECGPAPKLKGAKLLEYRDALFKYNQRWRSMNPVAETIAENSSNSTNSTRPDSIQGIYL